LEAIDVQFDLRCTVRETSQAAPARTGNFTVVRCRSTEPEIVRYFLTICEVIVRLVGTDATAGTVSTAIARMAALFQKRSAAPSRMVNGLFGELWIISASRDPVATLSCWRLDSSARFDFAQKNLRLDVKTTTGRLRVHTVSFDQCNPPPQTCAVLASMFVERLASGISLRTLIQDIETKVSSSPELLLKLHEVVADSLGASLQDGLETRFDNHLAQSSLQFFDALEVPAIRGPLPAGVGDVHFRSDFSTCEPTPVRTWRERNPLFAALLP